MKGIFSGLSGILILGGLVVSFNNCSRSDSFPADSTAEQAKDANSNSNPAADPMPSAPPSSDAVPLKSDLAELAGIYSGSGGTQVLFANGEYWALWGYGIIQMRYGKVNSAANGSFDLQLSAGNNAGTSVKGDYVISQSFNKGNYSSRSKAVPSFNAIAGGWWGNSHDGDTPNITISAAGQISGYSANRQCRFSGKFEPHPGGGDVFKVTLVRANCLANGITTQFFGIGMKNGPLLHVVALNGDKSQRFTWEGYAD